MHLSSYILHGNVATQLRHGGIITVITANFAQCMRVKEFLKIGQYPAKIRTEVLLTHPVDQSFCRPKTDSYAKLR